VWQFDISKNDEHFQVKSVAVDGAPTNAPTGTNWHKAQMVAV
jgi:hypothetical protein